MYHKILNNPMEDYIIIIPALTKESEILTRSRSEIRKEFNYNSSVVGYEFHDGVSTFCGVFLHENDFIYKRTKHTGILEACKQFVLYSENICILQRVSPYSLCI